MIQQLDEATEPDNALAEKVDKIMGEAMRYGEKQCSRKPSPWYSREIAQLRLWKSILRRHLSGFRKNRDYSDALNLLLKSYGLENKTLPPDKRQT